MAESSKTRTGQCLCGSVTITANQASNSVGSCHCNSCRKWSSGPYMELDCGTDVTIDGKEHVSIYDSSTWAERGFCAKCGSNLFYRLKQSGQHMVSVALFEDDDDLVFKQQVFIEEKPAFYTFANKTEDLTGAEIFAKYAPPSK